MSARQREVLTLLARGLRNKDIATALGISAETVRSHVAAVFERLEVDNRTEAAAAYLAWSAQPPRVTEVLQRPAIAVLPLRVAATDRTAAAIGLALARELVALLARWCWFPVVVHAANRDPRDLGDTSQAIAKQLGARFLLDGAVQRVGRGWRIDVHVTDATTGYSVWSAVHDVARDELREVPAATASAVVAAAYPRLVATIHAHLGRTPPGDDVHAWQLAHRAHGDRERRQRDANARAQAGFAAAIAREPALVIAHYGLGLAAYDEILNQWGDPAAALARLTGCAARILELAPDAPEGHYLAARRDQARGHHGDALPALRAAIAYNPSFVAAHALLGQLLTLTGDHAEAALRMQHAARLDPSSFVTGLAVSHFGRGDYAACSAAIEPAIARNPGYPFARALAAAAAWWSGDLDRALGHAAALAAVHASFTPALFRRCFGPACDATQRLSHALEQLAATCAASGSTSPGSGSWATAP